MKQKRAEQQEERMTESVVSNSGSRRHRLAAMVAFITACLGLALGAHASHAASGGGTDGAALLNQPWTGDFDGMVERHRIRALVVYSKTFYFLDGATQRGATYEFLKAFEKHVNQHLKKETLKVEVVFIPVTRDQLFPALVEGRGDIAASNLTVTPDREKIVDFSDPVASNVSEIVVTGPSGPKLSSVDDLAGQEIHVRESSSYYESLVRLNAAFARAGKPAVEIVLADERLEDEDLLEMLNADLIPMIVIDRHKGEFWAQIFEGITLHPDITVRTGGNIAWAYRKNSPKLEKIVNEFVAKNRQGTLLGNVLLKRYLKNASYVKNSLAGEELDKFHQMVEYFKKYSGQYGFDWLLMIAVGYQESHLDQSRRSPAGAVGVMQMLPSTAKDPVVGIPDIEKLEPNIHAGVKYLHYIHDRYFSDAAIDTLNQWLFTFASYNAGPAKVASLRKEATKMGLDPNEWFGNVEVVAAKRIGRETVQYVSNIYKYYIAYKLLLEQSKKRRAVKEKVSG
ncbi:MAG: lytic transglycosylase F [Gammaproteobacteria bacterium]|nr:lytic transglycosylase F [Gammaproteobacteria bacterium]